MKKLFNFNLALSLPLFASLAIFSCSKSSDAVPAETPLTSFLADSTVKITKQSGGYFEYGQKFQSIKAGKITRLGVRNPNPGTYRVAIWDADTKTVVATKTVEQTTANTQSWNDISPLSIEANKKYYVTYLSNNWFYVTPKTGGNFSYPFTKNNIIFLAYGYALSAVSALPKYPTNEPASYIAGYVDFTFQPD